MLAPLPRACPPGSPMGGRPGVLPLPASCLQEQGWPGRERAARIPCHPPTHTQHGQGVTLSVPLPHWGGPPQDQPITSYWQSWSWERSGESRPALLLQARGTFPQDHPPVGPLEHARHLSAGLGSLFTASHPIAVETRAWGSRGGRSQWLEERSPGIRMPNEERGAIGDTEILIRGSLWGGIYYSALIGCRVASQHPGVLGAIQL